MHEGVNGYFRKNLADDWAEPKLKELVEREVYRRKSPVIITGLEEEHTPAKKEKVMKKEIQIKRLIQATNRKGNF